MPHATHIKDILSSGTTASFEMFPPKTPKGLKQIFQTISKLKELNPDFFSVTYGAGGSTAERSLEIASAITNLAQVPCVAHFTCVGMNKEQVLELLHSLEFHGINNVLALRGDPPKGETSFVQPKGGFAYANELVAYIKEHSQVGVLVAGYPEGHTENPSKDDDFNHLVEKVKAGADGIVTQAFFDNRELFDFSERLQKAGLDTPLSCGIFPVSNPKQIQRIIELSGATVHKKLLAGIEKYQDDPESMEDFGTDFCIEQVSQLLDHGIKAFHFYTMNRARQTTKVLAALKDSFPSLTF